MTKKTIIWLIVLLLSELSYATTLLFPPELNYLKTFPQRFEYQLIDQDRFSIGDILFDASEMSFQITQVKSKTNLFFRWPKGFLTDGELVIKDPAGKAIWSNQITKNQLKISKPKSNSNSKTADLATFTIAEETTDILAKLERFSFFKFCINKEAPQTKVYLCSKDLFIKKTPKGMRVGGRGSLRPESFIEINGRPVDPQGIIFLNAPDEFVSLKALLLSGATIEIDTRMKSVEFTDIYGDADEELVTVRGKGALPTSQDQSFEKISEGEWQISLPRDRPQLYLEGAGGIPLKQEFMITGPVRNKSVQVNLASEPMRITYKDNMELELQPSPGLSLSTVDKSSQLRKVNESYLWRLSGLLKNQSNTRMLKVNDGKNDFFAKIDVQRASANESRLLFAAPLWLSIFTDIWRTDTYGYTIEYNQQMQKNNTDDIDQSSLQIGFNYRLSPGINFVEPSSKVGADLVLQKIDDKSFPMLAAHYQFESDELMISSFNDWTTARLQIGLAGQGKDIKFKNSMRFDLSFRKKAHDTLYYEYGIFANSIKAEINAIERSKTTGHLFGGIGWIY